MAKVLIQEGLQLYEQMDLPSSTSPPLQPTEVFRSALESQQPGRLKGAPRQVRLFRPS